MRGDLPEFKNTSKFERLFKPGTIGKLELPNRIVMAPMGTAFCDPDGRVSQRQIDYYAARARGGAGLIIIEGTKIEKTIDPLPAQPNAGLYATNYIAALSDLAEAIHDYGSRIALQLTPGNGRQAFIVSPANPPVSASAIPTYVNPAVNCRPLTKDEIKTIVKAYGLAAQWARQAGIDMIEIHGHTGYLIDQFMTPLWNKRTDEYGGNLEGRIRFPVEIIQEVKKKAGLDFPISFRISVEHRIPNGRGIEETQEIARYLEAAGVDVLHTDAGCYETSELISPPGYMGDACLADMAAAIKKAVTIPVIAVGNITPEAGEALLAEGQADFIASGRGLIADPDWPGKVRTGHRREVRPCIRCNEMCIGRISALKPISCSVNPMVGKEGFYHVEKTFSPKKVLIIGGGPAGLEAARVAKERGHEVILIEKAGFLGGQLRAAANNPFKKELSRLIDWWVFQLSKLKVDVRLNTEATPELITLLQPDAVVVATGAQPIIPDIPGISGESIIGVVDYHLGFKNVKGSRIVVAGGGLSGCDAALELAREGKQVTIIEMLSDLAMDAPRSPRTVLLRLLAEYGVIFLTNHKVKEFSSEGLLAEKSDGSIVSIPADTIILALGTRSDNALYNLLKERITDLYLIGDGSKTSRVGEAVHAGFTTGWRL